jgi:hypothetical protein
MGNPYADLGLTPVGTRLGQQIPTSASPPGELPARLSFSGTDRHMMDKMMHAASRLGSERARIAFGRAAALLLMSRVRGLLNAS